MVSLIWYYAVTVTTKDPVVQISTHEQTSNKPRGRVNRNPANKEIIPFYILFIRRRRIVEKFKIHDIIQSSDNDGVSIKRRPIAKTVPSSFL